MFSNGQINKQYCVQQCLSISLSLSLSCNSSVHSHKVHANLWQAWHYHCLPFYPHRHPTAVIKDITFTWTHFLSCCPAAIKPVSKALLPLHSLLHCSSHFRKGSPACKSFFVFRCSTNDFSDIPDMDTWKVSTNLTWLNILPARDPMFTYLN